MLSDIHPDRAPAVSTHDQMIPRLVVAEDGRVVFASPGFEHLVHASADALRGSKLQDLILFCDPDLALRDQPFSDRAPSSGTRAWVTNIDPGTHQIRLRDHGDTPFAFTFTWASVGDGARYLLICAADAGEDTFDFFQDDSLGGLPTPQGARVGPRVPSICGPAFKNACVRVRKDGGHVFLDLSDDVMLRLAQDGHIDHANRAFFAQLGFHERQLPILNFIELMGMDDRAHVRGIFMGLMHHEGGASPVHFETTTLDAEQKPRRIEWRLKQQGEWIFALGKDLTLLHDNIARMNRHKQQLAEVEAIAHMGDWRWQVGDTSLVWSNELYRIFGVMPGEFTPTIDHIRAMLHRADLPRVVQTFQRAMIEQNSYDMDFRITRPNGEVRYIRCEGRCECDDTGDVMALYGIMHDMTETARAEKELRDAKNAAERAYDSKSKFLANMSHELRTPLNAIIGFSEMMQRQLLGPIGTEKYLDYIDGIRQSGEHLLDLISDILDMSKIEAGKYTLDPEIVNLAKLTRLAISMVEGRARESCVDLGCNAFGDDIQITADRRAVLQIMLNILSNAIKFTEPGGSVRLELTSTSDEKIKFSVTDTGIGIPPHMLDVITKPFEQAANQYTRAHEGSGLGLAITKELTLMHGGHLDIQSTLGKGTTVTITLPQNDFHDTTALPA